MLVFGCPDRLEGFNAQQYAVGTGSEMWEIRNC